MKLYHHSPLPILASTCQIITVYKDPLGENATGKKKRSSGLETIDMRSSTVIADYAPEPSVSSVPDGDKKKLQDKVDKVGNLHPCII